MTHRTNHYPDERGFQGVLTVAAEVFISVQLLILHPYLILRGNCTETTARSYWSNKSTGITVDVPSEASLTPHLWGTIKWNAP